MFNLYMKSLQKKVTIDTEDDDVSGVPEQYRAEEDLKHLKEVEDIEEEKKRQEPRGIYS